LTDEHDVAGVLDYDSFGEWYDRVREELLEPALTHTTAALEHWLLEVLNERDLARIRGVAGRVKSKRRTWRKLHGPQYRQRIAAVDDIANQIDDLVGVRVTCINLRDVDMVQTALEELPHAPGTGLWLDPSSKRDYISEPKASGYRGWHVNLGVEVNGTQVVCELQVRTLLQDSWGELTHQETYSKEGELPPLVDVLSTRMADLLSILDDVAEDLRNELDRIDQDAVAGSVPVHSEEDVALAGVAADAGVVLETRWQTMDRPVDLATLAWALQREFGAEISDNWFGHGSFKRFLRQAIPDGEITTGRQTYLLPASMQGVDAAAVPTSDAGSAPREVDPIPGAIRQLRRVDSQFPLLEADEWPAMFEHLAESWRRSTPAAMTTGSINRLTKSARDLARGAGGSMSRRNFDYVVRALLAFDALRPDEPNSPSGQELAGRFATLVIERMVELRILVDHESKAARRVEQWLAAPRRSSPQG